MFKNREEAGRKLGLKLSNYKKDNPIILAIPNGGVEVAYEAAKYLNVEFALIIIKKLPNPFYPEIGFGAITENGISFIFENTNYLLSMNTIETIINEKTLEIEHTKKVFRENYPIPNIDGRTVIIIDDGIIMGSTMHAAIMLCKNKNAKKIIVAVPASNEKVIEEISEVINKVIVLEKLPHLWTVEQAYESCSKVTDKDVLNFIQKYKNIESNILKKAQ